MTMRSRGISDIQEQARGKSTMAKKDMRKEAAPAKSEKVKVAIKKRAAPLNAMSVGAANTLPMPPAAGLRAAPAVPAMKKGGSCKGYAKGGVTRADGCVSKGHTKGRFV